MAESSMKLPVLVDTAGKPIVPKQPTALAAGRSQPDQGKHKANQQDTRRDSRHIAAVEDGRQAGGRGPSRQQRTNKSKQPWQAKHTFEAMLDGPCKFQDGAKPSTHTTRQCN
ncbi:hypothetical protein ZWY2020_006428 [Hordeum vulgare]|nr:hypothetical protein ZWY2020_006428 [Hordeum vulgare]